MRRFATLASALIAFALAGTCSIAMGQEEAPPDRREFRAAFVSVAYNFDWPYSPGNTETQQRNQIRAIVARAREMNLNVIVLQARAFEDRVHKKTNHNENYTKYLNNGKEPKDYDPLCEWISACHQNGLELHVWVNPFRANGPNAHPGSGLPKPFQWKKHFWYDPTDPKVHKRIIKDIIKEILENPCKAETADTADTAKQATGTSAKLFDADGVDGLLIDHYFPEPPDEPPATKPLAPLQKVAPAAALMKKDKVSSFVEQLYYEIKDRKGYVKFGISPDKDPNVNPIADVPTWLAKPWCHYMVPELYVPPGQVFDNQLTWYHTNNMNTANVDPKPLIVAGLFTTRVEKPDPPTNKTWPAADIETQVKRSRDLLPLVTPGQPKKVDGGQAHYSYSALRSVGATGPADNIGDLLRDGYYKEPALVPACVPLPPGYAKPQKPTLDPPGNIVNQERDISWTTSTTPWLWEFWWRDKGSGTWTLKVLTADQTKTKVPHTADRVWLRAVDHFNRQGDADNKNL